MEKLKGKTIKLIGFNKAIDMQSVDILFNVTKLNIRTIEKLDMVHFPLATQNYVYLASEEDSTKILKVKQIIAEDCYDKKYFIITNCKVYVMNEDGKTIDTI